MFNTATHNVVIDRLRAFKGKFCLQVLATGLVLAGLCSVSAQDKKTENPNNQTPTTEKKSDAGSTGSKGQESTEKPPDQKANPGSQTGGERPAPAPTPDLSKVEVTAVHGTLALFDTIRVSISDLQNVLKAANNDPSKIVLLLDGYPLKGVPTRVGAHKKEDQPTDLEFDLRRTDNEETKKSWNSLLGRPSLFPTPDKKNVSVAVRLDGPNPQDFPTAVMQYQMTVVKTGGYWVFLVVLILFTALFIRWARNSDVLRTGPRLTDGKLQRYSLGRVQMAFWFFIVAASYVFIWMVTSEYRVLPGSVLALIGISAATALGAAMIDASGPGSVEASVTPQPTVGFFSDIFSDEQGKITFHRFQIAVWSIVLAVIFVASVYYALTMADFPDQLLALMGISSGTYLGFKFPEKQETQNRAAAAGGADPKKNPPPVNPNVNENNPPQNKPTG